MIGKRKDGKKLRGVGGKAFPNDFNWLCPVCAAENRAFETECPNCEWNERVKPLLPLESRA